MFWAKPAGNAKGVSIYRHWIFVSEALISSRAPLNAGSGNGQKLDYISIYIYTYWLVVSNIFYFPFHTWDDILPIDELHHFSRWFLTTNQIYIGRWVISLRNSKGWWDDSHVIYLTAHSHDFNGEFKVICLVDFVCTSSDLKMYVPCFVQPQSLSFSALNALKCPLSHEALVSIPSPNNIWTAEVGRQRGMPSQY